MENRTEHCIAKEVEAVITSFNQGNMILEAVRSLCEQTVLPSKIIIVDDGSTDKTSLDILNAIKVDTTIPIPVVVVQQKIAAYQRRGIRRFENQRHPDPNFHN